MKPPTVYKMIEEAVTVLGGKASYKQLKKEIWKKWPDAKDGTISSTCIELSVNRNSRIHYDTNFQPRLTYPPSKYDVLYHVSDGNVELYNPKKHGIWEIYVNEEGNKKVRKVGSLKKNKAIIQVRNWSDVTDNLHEFSYVSKDESRPVYKRLTSFFHWYYFPKQDAFAPSKFLGYVGTTAENYNGLGTGTETKKALAQFFVKLDKESQQFKELYAKLEDYLQSFGKEVNAKVATGSGGIYIPKDDAVTEEDDMSQELYDKVRGDIDAAEAEDEDTTALEGKKGQRLVNYYERDSKLRAKAVKHHGTKCCVCGFDFEKIYGKHGAGFIEVHHTVPLHTLDGARETNYIDHMAVLCANCHRMVHRKRDEPLSIDELKDIYHQSKPVSK